VNKGYYYMPTGVTGICIQVIQVYEHLYSPTAENTIA